MSMDSAAVVLDILSKLQFLGFCADLNIPEAASADPSVVFDAVLAAFLRQVYPGGREARPLPAALVDGRRVDLLRLFTAVRAAGGYAATSSSPIAWAAAAESAGLDAALAAPVKLLYAKYLGALDRWIQRLQEAQGVPCSDGNGTNQPELFVGGADGRDKEKPFLDGNEGDQQHAILKRKRPDMAGMLGWVRELAKNAWYGDAVNSQSVDGYFSTAMAVRAAVSRKRARRASMANGALLQEIFPMGCERCMSSTYVRTDAKAKFCKELQLLVEHPGSCVNELTRAVQDKNGPLMITEQVNLTGRGNHESKKQHNSFDGWLFSSQQRNEVPLGSDYQAKVPQWTGELTRSYDNPETLKWLGTRVWPPENGYKKAPFCVDPIGKGREEICGCKVPGSVDCVRFHVAERKLLLRHELGSAFFDWGFDRMGEEIALSWTDQEEANFKAVVRLNVSPSHRNFWNRLLLLFHLKGRKELVSYYFNCFLLRRRCYQNRITPKNIDSDDEDETEFGFLGSRLGHSATKYHSTKHNICVQSTHCMDLDP